MLIAEFSIHENAFEIAICNMVAMLLNALCYISLSLIQAEESVLHLLLLASQN